MQKKTFDNYDSPEYAKIGAILKREEFRKVKSYSNTPKAHSIASNEDSFDRFRKAGREDLEGKSDSDFKSAFRTPKANLSNVDNQEQPPSEKKVTFVDNIKETSPKESEGNYVIIDPEGRQYESSPQFVRNITENFEENKTDEINKAEEPESVLKLDDGVKKELFANLKQEIKLNQQPTIDPTIEQENKDANEEKKEDENEYKPVEYKGEEHAEVDNVPHIESQPKTIIFNESETPIEERQPENEEQCEDEEKEEDTEEEEEIEEESDFEPSNFGFGQVDREIPVQNFIQGMDPPQEEIDKKIKIKEEDSNEDSISHQSFGREKLIQHISVSNQDSDILDFKKAFDLKYNTFKQNVINNYQKIRFEYLKQMDFAVRENERDNNSSIDYLEHQVDVANAEKEAAVKRASQSRIILANILREKYNTFYIKRACFQAWKYFHEWKHYEEAKSKFCDNYYRKRCLQMLFNHWRKFSHDAYVERIFQIKEEFDLQEQSKLLYLSQLQAKIEEETGLILKIPEDYLNSIDNGLSRIFIESKTLRGSELLSEVRMTQKEIIFK